MRLFKRNNKKVRYGGLGKSKRKLFAHNKETIQGFVEDYGSEEPYNWIYSENIRFGVYQEYPKESILALGSKQELRDFMLANILQAFGNYIIPDEDGALYAQTSQFLESQGYQVRIVDCVAPENGTWCDFISHLEDADAIIESLTQNLQYDYSGNAKLRLQCSLKYEKQKSSFTEIAKSVHTEEQLGMVSPDKKHAHQEFSTRMQHMADMELKSQKPWIRCEDFHNQPQAIFVKYNAETKLRAQVFYSGLMRLMAERARQYEGCRLKYPLVCFIDTYFSKGLSFILDENGNNIRRVILYPDVEAMERDYDYHGQYFIATSNTVLLFSCTNRKTAEYMARSCDANWFESVGISEKAQEKPMHISPEQVLSKPENEVWVCVTLHSPMRDTKYDVTTHPNFKYLGGKDV